MKGYICSKRNVNSLIRGTQKMYLKYKNGWLVRKKMKFSL